MSFSIFSSDLAEDADRDREGPGRFLAFAALAAFVVLAALWTLTSQFRQGFLAPEYGMWVAKKEMVASCQFGSTVILGDSRMVADVLPGPLGNATNLALGGASPIEMYYMLLRASRCPNPPRRVVISFSPAQLMEAEYFWPRTALFDFLDYDELDEVRAASRRLGDDLLYQSPNIGDFDAVVTNWLHAHHFPSYYMSSIINGRVVGRLGTYHEIHDSVEAMAGHHLYGHAAGAPVVAEEAEMRRFHAAPLLDDYFRRLLALAERNGMRVDYIAAPWNDTTFERLKPGFTDQLAAYLAGLSEAHPDFRLLAPVTHMDDAYFGDPAHLNAKGAAAFTAQVVALLRVANNDHGTVRAHSAVTPVRSDLP